MTGMASDWDGMSSDEKLEILHRDMVRILAVLNELTYDLDGTWDFMRGAHSELGKINKDVATLKALWPYKKKPLAGPPRDYRATD
jgi:GH18 family chitinase